MGEGVETMQSLTDEERKRLCEELRFHKMNVCDEAADEIERLATALRPFADLINRKWEDKEASIQAVKAGAFVSELQAINLADVIRANDAY